MAGGQVGHHRGKISGGLQAGFDTLPEDAHRHMLDEISQFAIMARSWKYEV
jgi:hypothetical protein